MAVNVTLLVRLLPPSSSLTTGVRDDTLPPVYTPKVVSKLLPMVSTWTVPADVAVQAHHTDLPPMLPARLGSPASFVAFIFVPVSVAVVPTIGVRLAKLLFVGPIESCSPVTEMSLR